MLAELARRLVVTSGNRGGEPHHDRRRPRARWAGLPTESWATTGRSGLGFDIEIHSDGRPLHELVAAIVNNGGPDVQARATPPAAAWSAPPATCSAWIPHVADEGRLVAFVAPRSADAVLAPCAPTPAGRHACAVGAVTDGPAGPVTARTLVGASRIVDMLIGEQLLRIC